jgi:hypothetical protein
VGYKKRVRALEPENAALNRFAPDSRRAWGKRRTHRGDPQVAEGFYRALILLAPALEAETPPGSRYVIELVPTSVLPVEDASRLGQQLADTIEHSFTTYFAIPRERLSLHISRPHSTVEGQDVPSQGPQRWRLGVFRQE